MQIFQFNYINEYCELDTLYNCHQTAEQIIFERKLAKGFSSNNEGDGPLTSDIRYIRYIRRKYTVKHRRLSSKPLKRGAKSALDEPPLKWQRINDVANDLNSEQVRVSKRTLNSVTLSLSKRQKTSKSTSLLDSTTSCDACLWNLLPSLLQ